MVPRRRALADRPLDTAGQDRRRPGRRARPLRDAHRLRTTTSAAVARLREHGLDVHEEDFEDTRAVAYVDRSRTATSSSSGRGAHEPARPARRARTSSSTRTTRSTGTRGATRPSQRARRGQADPASRSATPPATGATSWSTSPSRTTRRPRCMNERFVSVKVDREERPDVDSLYMDAVVAHDRPRRLADDRLPDARRASRSSAAPTTRPSRGTGCRASSRCLTAVADAYRERRARRRTRRPRRSSTRSASRPSSGRSTEPLTGACSAGAPARSRAVRPRVGRLGRRAEVPARLDARVPRCACTCAATRRSADGHARPSTRWPRAACTTSSAAASTATRSTRELARPALREDALRQRAARPRAYLHGWVVTGDGALPAA